VHLATPQEAMKLLNKQRDKDILVAALKHAADKGNAPAKAALAQLSTTAPGKPATTAYAPAVPAAPVVSTVPYENPQGLEHHANVKAGSIKGNVSTKGMTRYESQSEHMAFAKVMGQHKLSGAQRTAVDDYKGSGYDAVNAQCRSQTTLSLSNAIKASYLDEATASGIIPPGTVLYRGVGNWKKAGLHAHPSTLATGDEAYHDNGFSSASTSKSFAGQWAQSRSGGKYEDMIVFEYKFLHPKTGCHVAGAQGNYSDGEQEVILPRAKLLTKIAGYRVEKIGGKDTHILTLETIS